MKETPAKVARIAKHPTTAIVRKITAYIRQGAYPVMAAEAAGIPRETFERWLTRAQQPKPTKLYRALLADIRQAIAQARIFAELQVFQDDPKMWLKSGPGREQPDTPGWTTTAKPYTQPELTINRLEDPAWNELWGTILTALTHFPEARLALAEALATVPVVVPRG